MNKEFTCQQCGIKFIGRERPDRPDPKFCSRKCKGITKTQSKKQTILICQQCGKEFIKGKIQNVPLSKYCSMECYRQQRKPEHICLMCGKIFLQWNSLNPKFCSKKCGYLHRGKYKKGRAMVEYICQQCHGKFFHRKINPSPKFCSKECQSTSGRGFKEYICIQCGKNFSRGVRKEDRNYRFCSKACRYEFFHKQFICQFCGKTFTKHISTKHPFYKFCSVKCAREGQIGVVRKPPKEFICEICGKTFHRKVSPNAEYPIRKYCTPQCRNIYLNEKNRNDPYWREKVLAGLSKSFKLHGTKPELKCKEILENLSVDFEYQYPVLPKFIVDFLCYANIVIQVDGEYWHGHPRFEPLSPMQISQKKRDVSQDKYLAVHGYKVFRVWENELSEDKIKSIFSSQLG